MVTAMRLCNRNRLERWRDVETGVRHGRARSRHSRVARGTSSWCARIRFTTESL